MIARGSSLDGTVPESAPTFAQRVGGRWVISWQAYTLGATVNTVLLGLTGGSVGAESVSLSDFPRWCALGALASAVVGIYALVANATVFRHKRTTPAALPVSVAFHASVGLLFAAVVVGCAGIFRLEPPSPAWTFLCATSGIALWWGLTMASLFEGRERFRLRRQALLERAVEEEFAALIAADASTEFEDRVRAEVSAVLGDTHTELMKQLPSSADDAAPHSAHDIARDSASDSASNNGGSPESWGSVADSLRETARDSVRPLSHRLWSSTEQQYPAPRVFDVLVRTVRHPQPAPLASFFIVLLGYLRASLEAFGPVLGVGAAVLLATSVAGVLYGIRWIPAAAATPTFWLVFVLCEVAGLAFLSWAPGSIGSAETAGSVLAMGLSVLAPTAVASLKATRRESLRALEDSSQANLAQRLARERSLAVFARANAEHLHGTVQTTLNACAAAIDQAAASGNAADFARAVDRAITILNTDAYLNPTDTAHSPTHEDVTTALQHVRDQWFGLVEISVTVTQASDDPPDSEATSRVRRIVEECVANAVRHGGAGHIDIAVEVSENDLSVVVIDDGQGLRPDTSPAEGLGTHLMRAHASGGFSREASSTGGCIVHARVLLT
ncbi:MAG: sensor histidine kinase [Candidatus Nanopelagicales bacterium]